MQAELESLIAGLGALPPLEAVAQQQQSAAQQMAWFTTVLDGMVEPAE